jgi:hypothetical protein
MTYRILSSNEALELIQESLKGSRGVDEGGDWADPPIITIREEKTWGVRVVDSYTPLINDLNSGLIQILATIERDLDSEWGGEVECIVIFKMSNGHYGMAFHISQWDMSFYRENSRLEIAESCDWDVFYNFALIERERDIVNIFMNPSLGLTSPQEDERELAKLICESNFIWTT